MTCPSCGAEADSATVALGDTPRWHNQGCPVRQEATRTYYEDDAWLAAHPGRERLRPATASEQMTAAARLGSPLDRALPSAHSKVTLNPDGTHDVNLTVTLELRYL